MYCFRQRMSGRSGSPSCTQGGSDDDCRATGAAVGQVQHLKCPILCPACLHPDGGAAAGPLQRHGGGALVRGPARGGRPGDGARERLPPAPARLLARARRSARAARAAPFMRLRQRACAHGTLACVHARLKNDTLQGGVDQYHALGISQAIICLSRHCESRPMF